MLLLPTNQLGRIGISPCATFLQLASSRLSMREFQLVSHAYCFAAFKHHLSSFPFRDDSSPYIHHPTSVGNIGMEEFGVYDVVCISLSVLHDVVENCGVSITEIRNNFGRKIAWRLRLLSRLNGRDEYYVEMISDGDWRVLYVKCLDRLHNLRTAQCKGVEFCMEQLRETEEIFLGSLGLIAALRKSIPSRLSSVPTLMEEKLRAECQNIRRFIQEAKVVETA